VGLEEPVVDPKLWVEMEGLRVHCDRSLLVFWGRPFEIAKSLLADVEEKQKLKIPALRGAMGRYGGSEVPSIVVVYADSESVSLVLHLKFRMWLIS